MGLGAGQRPPEDSVMPEIPPSLDDNAIHTTDAYVLWEHRHEPGRRAITCRRCQLTSHHPQDVQARFCGCCGHWHDDPDGATDAPLGGRACPHGGVP